MNTDTVTHAEHIRRLPRGSRLVLAAAAIVVFGSVIAVPTTAWAVPVPWRNCGNPTDAISIQRLDASVWPAQAGKNITLSSSWNLTEVLSRRSVVKVTTHWSSGQASARTFEFDQSPLAASFGFALFGHDFSQQRMPLPIPAGPYTQSLTLNIPSNLSAQTLDVDMAGFDGAGHQVVCMQLILPIK